MRKLSRFEKFGIIAAILVVCTFFYVKRVYEPQEARLKKTVKALNKVIGQVNNLKEVPPQATVKYKLKANREKLEELKLRMKNNQLRTGTAREVTRLLSDINKKMADHGLRVKALAPDGRIKEDPITWNLFRIDMVGTFYEFLDFMQALKDMPDVVKIEGLRMEKLDGRRLKITFNLMI
ncbi:type 4a pilus biogenesis protein PilO [uncultured Desulfosarcina sp.]|uniref:type 4a pilus biogenesis protein PilO n=1 Tax=uncultured Desulfosarcina sp. TaxID=218289 RepID=UPI0029C78F10|nr:type 4a pilus biogenesis protein PilO [uncultured Desulfosarcina sp.]